MIKKKENMELRENRLLQIIKLFNYIQQTITFNYIHIHLITFNIQLTFQQKNSSDLFTLFTPSDAFYKEI